MNINKINVQILLKVKDKLKTTIGNKIIPNKFIIKVTNYYHLQTGHHPQFLKNLQSNKSKPLETNA